MGEDKVYRQDREDILTQERRALEKLDEISRNR